MHAMATVAQYYYNSFKNVTVHKLSGCYSVRTRFLLSYLSVKTILIRTELHNNAVSWKRVTVLPNGMLDIDGSFKKCGLVKLETRFTIMEITEYCRPMLCTHDTARTLPAANPCVWVRMGADWWTSELKQTGHRLLTAHVGKPQPCANTETHHRVVTGGALGL